MVHQVQIFNVSGRILRDNLVISLTVTNISPVAIANIGICPNVRAPKFAYSVEKV